MDTFYLCDKNSLILFEAERDSLLFRQMEKVGLAPSDSIPDDLYPDILRLDLDSALYVFGEFLSTAVRRIRLYGLLYGRRVLSEKKSIFADS